MFKLISVASELLALGMRRFLIVALPLAVLAAVPLIPEAEAAAPDTVTCTSGKLSPQNLRGGSTAVTGQQPNLVVSTACTVSSPGNYFYGNVNIVAGGTLTFKEPQGTGTLVNFWASNIIVEAGGALIAGSQNAPYGSRRGVLDIYIYGPNQSTGDPAANPGQGALCYGQLTSTTGPCGIPLSLWNDNGTTLQTMPGAGGVSDYFYQYGPNYGDGKCTDGTTWTNGQCGTSTGQVGYFGYKVLAVSYNGTLKLFGYKGTPLKRAKAVRPFSLLFPSQGGRGSSIFGQFAPNQAPDSDEFGRRTGRPSCRRHDRRPDGDRCRSPQQRLQLDAPRRESSDDGGRGQGHAQHADLVPGTRRPLVVGQ